MTHRPADSSARPGFSLFVISLVGVVLIGVVWTLVAGDGTPTPPTVATSSTQPGTTGVTDASEPGATDGSTPSVTDAPAATEAGTALPPIKRYRFEAVVEGLQQPTAVVSPPGDDRLFVTERIGRVKVVAPDGTVLPESFLNITDRVLANGIEQGLLGLAFHPDYAANGRFFVYYTNKDAKRTLAEYRVSTASKDQADHSSERILFTRSQPEGSTDIRHYGGGLNFGPDGYLWVSVGDGADSRDQGQDPNTIFGTLLRLDVDSGDPYGTPGDNPFVNGGGTPEVWAYGLRNPWRFTIDQPTRLIYIGDVGQGAREEINVLSIDDDAGANLGWANVEGTMCFFEKDCDPAAYHLPTIEYDHDAGCSVTGGVVYRGSAIPELDGHYFYGDWCKGWIKSFLYVDGVPTEERDWADVYDPTNQPNGFGNDANGEVYVATFGGSILKLVADR